MTLYRLPLFVSDLRTMKCTAAQPILKAATVYFKTLQINGSFMMTVPYWVHFYLLSSINRLTPNDPYMGRTAPLTSKRCILYIYSTNTGIEYFRHALYSPFFSLQNAVCFIMLTCLVLYYSHFIYREC